MEVLEGWEARADGWLDTDLALLEGDAGWRRRRAPEGIELWSRPMSDDPNHLFRWRLAAVEADADRVYDGFVARILELHREWTKEYVDGRIVAVPRADARVLYQRFDPGLPGIAPRDLCSLEITRRLPGGAWLVSHRSVDAVPAAPGHARIDWWGAALCRPTADGRCSLDYLDRENQGGWFPAWAMNGMMPGYLVVQAREVARWFRHPVDRQAGEDRHDPRPPASAG